MLFKVMLLKVIGRMSPMFLTKVLYKKTFGKSLDLKHPISLNEKIHWLKFYGDTSQWALLSDKYRVREYVKLKGFEDILVKLYGSWENANDIDWAKLPNQFVLKANNGCGDVTICKDKSKLNKRKIIKYYNGLMKEKFGIQTGQLHYKDIKPCIIAEELLDASKQPTPSSSLIDYKIWCFDGIPTYIFVYLNRNKAITECMVYDVKWNAHPECLIKSKHFSICDKPIEKPGNLEEMLKVASVLSEGNPEMRVDLYYVNGKVYFGELTLTAACGFMNHFTDEFMIALGSRNILPCDKK